MIQMATGRQTRNTGARGTLAVFVVAWLNLMLAPCAMAFDGVAEHDCPHCPPSQADAHAGHDMSDHAANSHDDMVGTMPCAGIASDCSGVDELNYDGRTLKLELKDSPLNLAIAIHPAIPGVVDMRPADYCCWHRTRSPPRGTSTPLNVLYCVYLN